MKKLIKTYWIAIIAVLVIGSVFTSASIKVINLTKAGYINWSR